MPETIVLDASALVEALIGTPQGVAVRQRLRGCDLHAPAHIDAEALSALGRLHRSGELDANTVSAALSEIALAPIIRHPLAGLLAGAWAARDQLRLVDALYIELATELHATLLTTNGQLARARPIVELVS
ncbi:MAG: type II toxin-antitoxin system VapC family toxin [Solirubrobacteraceae bacterium]